MATSQNFGTVSHDDFKWPYAVPLVAKPGQPPMNTGVRLFATRIDPEDCPCDIHGHEKNKNRYKYLADKERQIVNQLMNVNTEMTNLASALLDSNCVEMDETMQTVYKTDYSKRGLPIHDYRQLVAAVDSPYCSPIATEVLEIREGYRDPTNFRHTALERPHIQPAKTFTLFEVPETFSMWGEPFTSRSEYMDNFSKMGLSNMKNRQQYLEPIPSSRKRFGDCKLLLPTEYSRKYIKRRPVPAEIIIPRDRFSERIEEGEIDPRVASIPTELDEAAEQLVHKHFLDYQRSVYQLSYKDHWAPQKLREGETGEKINKEKDLQSELLLHIHNLYFNPHNEKVLAPPTTAKRMIGYIRPKLLHGSLSTYQDTFARTGATIMLREHEKKSSDKAKETGGSITLNNQCAEYNTDNN